MSHVEYSATYQFKNNTVDLRKVSCISKGFCDEDRGWYFTFVIEGVFLTDYLNNEEQHNVLMIRWKTFH